MFSLQREIVTAIPYFTSSSTVSECLLYLENKGYSHLPIVDENHFFLGNLLTEDLENTDEATALREMLYDLEHFYLTDQPTPSIFEALNLLSLNDANIIPYLTEEGQLLGIICKEPLSAVWNDSIFLQEHGEHIVVSKATNTFSLSAVSQIVESNNAKLFGVILLNSNDSNTNILIKTNNINTNAILDDFRRHGYEIESNHNDDLYRNELRDRSDYFNKYMNI
ncbi:MULTISPECIES: CBS domain-containing protein [Myroides]|uniref:CBS domain-containing protein n=1 Tax=Myroides albus TaxID=2562892 RepID=A0A6I3LKX8_9FLAO|nr:MULTISPECIES: CBS domain-containing protein [Myroides]MTG96812.1 CBS domain-containing protein [Myroides albus]MVX36917.1 CBS domain-containing protein [Myroides sp. LoEW2-1]UVD78438.1 CBS domain-containing protein [Myroides albus]